MPACSRCSRARRRRADEGSAALRRLLLLLLGAFFLQRLGRLLLVALLLIQAFHTNLRSIAVPVARVASGKHPRILIAFMKSSTRARPGRDGVTQSPRGRFSCAGWQQGAPFAVC